VHHWDQQSAWSVASKSDVNSPPSLDLSINKQHVQVGHVQQCLHDAESHQIVDVDVRSSRRSLDAGTQQEQAVDGGGRMERVLRRAGE